MKNVSLTQLKNSFGSLMALVKNRQTSLLVFERDTPIIKIIYAGALDTEGDENLAISRLERAGLLQRAGRSSPLSLEEIEKLRVTPKKKGVDIVKALLQDREEDR
jgi:hypothetical protein